MAEILREEDGRHPASAELALNPVPVGQAARELSAQVSHSGS
jgi:hypothetical protein